MDQITKRMRYNPDGSLLIKRWDDKLVVKRKADTAYSKGQPADPILLDSEAKTDETPYYDYKVRDTGFLEESARNWETELDYY